MIRGLQCFFGASLAQVYGSQAHPGVGVALVDLEYFVEALLCFRESASPSQDARAPSANIHVVRRKSDLLINDTQGVVPMVSVGVFSNLGLPSLVRLLRLDGRSEQDASEGEQSEHPANAARTTPPASRQHLSDGLRGKHP